MKIISWNVNGIRAAEKKGLYDFIEKENADIICLQETKAFKEQLNEEMHTPKPYHSYWHKGEVKGYSGVATFSKVEAIQYKNIFDDRYNCFYNEGRVVETEFNNFVLLNIYFPNGSPKSSGEERLSFKLKFYDLFLEYINNYRNEGKSIIVCGDYNIAHTEIDLARPKENVESIGFLPEERVKIDEIIKDGYIDTFRLIHKDKLDSYTWWSYRTRARDRNIGWRLDYFFISPDLKDKVKHVAHLDSVLGSDHCPVSLEIDI